MSLIDDESTQLPTTNFTDLSLGLAFLADMGAFNAWKEISASATKRSISEPWILPLIKQTNKQIELSPTAAISRLRQPTKIHHCIAHLRVFSAQKGKECRE
jgi:hypothetical protein